MFLRELVETPRPLPAPFGLINSKTLVRTTGHWENGITYEVNTEGLFARVYDACDYTAGALSLGNAPGSAGAGNTVYGQDYAPYVIEATDGCRSSIGLTPDERKKRASEALELMTNKAVERQFWGNGFGSNLNSSGNFSLMTAPTDTLLGGVAVRPRRALAALEQALADHGAGTRGAVHVTRDTLSLLRLDMDPDAGDSDNVLWTPGGNMLIGGVGYTGDGPSARTAGHVWAYATGPVAVNLSPIKVSDEPSKITGPVGVESFHTNNTLVYTAERFAAVTVNGTRVYAVLIDLDG